MLGGAEIGPRVDVERVGDVVTGHLPGPIRGQQRPRADAKDLELLGIASNIVTVPFRINGAPPTP